MTKIKTKTGSEEPQIVFVPVDKLDLDPDNPRLPKEVDGHNEAEVLEWFLSEGNGNLPELMSSIGQQGFFPGEPLLVVEHANNRFLVVEGNRRLAAVKLLNHPDLAPAQTKTVAQIAREASFKVEVLPVLVYDSRDRIVKYLGYRHVTGIKTWGALAKAKYLKQLSELPEYLSMQEDVRFRALAKTIGTRSDVVRRQLAGFQVYERIEDQRYFNIKDMTEGEIDFSLLTTALSYSNLSSFIGLSSPTDLDKSHIDDSKLQKLTKWMFERIGDDGKTRLGESRRLKDLNAVVASKEALRRFEKGDSLDQARLFTDAPIEGMRKSIDQSMLRLRAAYETLPMVRSGLGDDDVESVSDIETTAKDLKAAIKSRLINAEQV